MKQTLKALLPIAVLLVLWQAAASAKLWSEYVLPSPERVLRAFATMAQSGVLFENIWVSFFRVLTGFSIAFALAFLLGTGTGLRHEQTALRYAQPRMARISRAATMSPRVPSVVRQAHGRVRGPQGRV